MNSYLGWIIAAVVLGMFVYPLLQIIPNDKQKRQVAFRQAAMKKGLHIKMRTIELPQAIAKEYQAVTECAAYSLHTNTKLTQSYISLRSQSQKNEWFWLNDLRPSAPIMREMLKIYETLPLYCLAVEQDPAGSTLFFKDDLTEDKLDEIIESLNKLNLLISL